VNGQNGRPRRDGVVDVQSKVYRIDSLRIADGSIMLTITAENAMGPS
jgi:choline dehydrogenase-like flavoprotein